MRKIRHCPCCAYSFKNFKWRKTWKYDGDVACCPKCLLPAIEWKDFKPKRLYNKTSICDTAPYPECNGANGCDTCEHQEED